MERHTEMTLERMDSQTIRGVILAGGRNGAINSGVKKSVSRVVLKKGKRQWESRRGREEKEGKGEKSKVSANR
ncbi:hypothetical protein PRIPAC_70107 [Pristionchus pacificus]|uniref:Uncharacterized protein n=1 Tax=Pristionchus pacificus TaxID=54126 RepID=A0A2A6CGE5_PRIPA|nr:hypothetical protein PRIPAC_70107 [Pristionchus pacificus]|eukprot:PDM77160.1 hypothetical protein PRIPAC_43072 [Pristionchus pacificus]